MFAGILDQEYATRMLSGRVFFLNLCGGCSLYKLTIASIAESKVLLELL